MRRLFALLGDPVAHSRSPAIHARAFALLGEDAVYAPCQVPPAELKAAFDGLRTLGAAGWNVTVPHKIAAAGLCDKLSDGALRAGAVNCVVREGSRLVGYNTDGPGVLRALRQAGLMVEGGRAVVLGAGGSASAVALSLAERSGQITVLNRTGQKARALSLVLQAAGARSAGFALSDEPAQAALAEADLVIHCSTVGMGEDRMLIDPVVLSPSCALVDLVYAGAPGSKPGETALLQTARARGLRCVDGLDVLVHQAIASLEIWLRRVELESLAARLRDAAIDATSGELAPPAGASDEHAALPHRG